MIKSILEEDGPLPFANEGQNQARLETDYRDAFEGWKKSPTPTTRGQLLKTVQPVVDRAVYTYAGKQASPSVKGQARLLALQAFDSYDPRKGNMRNHLMGQLRGLQRYAGQQNQIISIPERIVLDRRHLVEAEDQLRDNLGRDPSDLEIADHTGLSLKRINHIRGASPGIAASSLVDPETGEPLSPASTIPGHNQNDDALRQFIYYDLDNIDRVVMDYTLGLHGSPQLPNTEIAKRLGLTAGAISQRKAKIQAMMDEAMQMELFGEG